MRFARHKTYTFQYDGSIGLLDRILCLCSLFFVKGGFQIEGGGYYG